MIASRGSVRIAAVVALVTTSGCSVVIDTIYLAGDRRFDTWKDESAPTGETRQTTEYAAQPVEGGLEVTCQRVIRGIDRRWSVSRTWQRRGGYDRDAYLATAVIAGLFGALTGGVVLGLCLGDEPKVGCEWTAAAAPLFADMGYGLVRRAMTKPPKLIARERGPDSVALGAPLQSEPIACDDLRGIALGQVSGYSPTDSLSAESSEPQRLIESGARQLALAGTHATLTATDAESWPSHARLWAIDGEGIAHEVAIDRCAALRPFAPSMTPTIRTQFDTDCRPQPGAASTSSAPATPATPPAEPAAAPLDTQPWSDGPGAPRP